MMHRFTTGKEGFARGFLSCESESLAKKIACGLLGAAQSMPLSVSLKTGLPYAFPSDAYIYSFGSGIVCRGDILDSLIRDCPEEADDFLYMRKEMKRHITPDLIFSVFTEQEIALNNEEGAMWGGGSWLGHAVPDFIDVARYGTDAVREKIEKYRGLNPDRDNFYDALHLALDALDTLAARFRDMAADMLKTETDAAHIRKLEKIRDTFTHAAKRPCRDFAEACIVYTMVFTFDGIDSPGRFDQYMYDFWSSTDEQLRREYLEYIWEFFHETRTWNLCISGSDENWNDLTNDLCYAVLDVARKYRYQTPNLTMRCHRNTPEKLLREAAKTIASGIGMPTLYNDEAVVPALERLGIPSRDAHEYVMNGCNQIDIQGKSHMGLEDGEVNIAKAVEYALHNGRSGITGRQVAPETGDPRGFGSFEDFYAAFLRQLDYLIDTATGQSNKTQRVLANELANPLRSIFIEGCVEKGIDYKAGGPLYNHGQVLAEGVADAVDSLAAIKKYVYEDKRFTMAELLDALDKNFDGYDDMHHLLKTTELKFGNDNDYVDSIAKDVVDHFNSYLLTVPTFRGGFYGGGCSPFVRAPSYGARTGALPNGKKKGETLLADSIGATPGCDTNGPTALLKSCLKFDHTLPTSGFILNIKFDKKLFESEVGQEGFLALYRAYFGNGGQQISAYTVSADELLDARKHPEKHRNLIVRVGGYSDYFVNLSGELQENVIKRTYHGV
jgi:formate C-acetyltransferase